jgi:large conductance mechanosensitive channel
MSLAKEFKDFAMKGNVVDLAVGVIIGAAFGKIVAALVDQVLMPPIGMLIGGVDFSQLKIVIQHAAADGKGEVAIGYGAALQALVNFIIVAWCLFMVIKGMNKMKKPVAGAPPPPEPEDVTLLREIRDLLRK